jgi:hypothetical protein
MTISAVGSSNWSRPALGVSSAHSSAFTAVATSVSPHQFGPNDPLNQFLTDEDRSVIQATTGIDVRPNGEIMISMAALDRMGVNGYAAAKDSIGQIAADRANGKLTGTISADYLNQLIKQFSPRVVANLDPFGAE